MRVSGIQGSSAAGAAPVSTGGARAEQAYRAAVKQLNDAQKKLNQDATSHADDKVIQLDPAAVTAAAVAVAAAAAELARQSTQASQATSGQSAPDGSAGAASAAASDTAAGTSARTAAAAWRVDLYA